MNRFTILLLIMIVLTDCEDIYHKEVTSIAKIESYDELVSAAGGVYGRLAQAINNRSCYDGYLKGDDLASQQMDYSQFYGSGCRSVFPYVYNSFSLNWTWENFYKVIASANNIIVQYNIESVQNLKTGEILGEIYLIRAYCYFRLTRTYGQVPLIDDIDINMNQSKASFEEIYKFIENDLNVAMKLLPKNTSDSRVPFVTPHRGAAKAMLAEVYMSWAGYPLKDDSKFAMAAREAWEVIDSANFFGLGLLDDFSNLWDQDHLYNMESLFSVYFENPAKLTTDNPLVSIYGESNVNRVYTGRAYRSDNRNSRGFKLNTKSMVYTTSFYPAELLFFNNFPQGHRKDITFFLSIYVPYQVNSFPEFDTGFVNIDIISGCSRIGYRKFYLEPFEIPRSNYSNDYDIFGINRVYLFRYAQTLLTYAEAAARAGLMDSKAYDCMNQIRRRAHKVDLHLPSVYDIRSGLSPEVFADSVVWERAWELCGESEGRWFDLVRLEQVENLPNLRDLYEVGPPEYPCNKEDYFFPIPVYDRNFNPNL